MLIPIKHPKCHIVDLDGTIVEKKEGLEHFKARALPGAVETLEDWLESGDTIIIWTARPEKYRERTEKQLERENIPYHQLLMDKPYSHDITIYDDNKITSQKVIRDYGISMIFVSDLILELEKAGVDVDLSRDRWVYTEPEKTLENRTVGYFDDENMRLAVATGNRSIKDWLPTFLHEYSHFKQMEENTPGWDKYDEAACVLSDWTNQRDDLLTLDQVIKAIRPIIEIELDAERRTVELIQQYHILDAAGLDDYIRSANAYIIGYFGVATEQQWWHTTPYNIPELMTQMKPWWYQHYSIYTYQKYANLYKRYCFKT